MEYGRMLRGIKEVRPDKRRRPELREEYGKKGTDKAAEEYVGEMRKIELPEEYGKFLETEGIPVSGLCYAARYDRGDKGEYGEGMVLLIRDSILILEAEGPARGRDKNRREIVKKKSLALNESVRIAVLRDIGGGMLAAGQEGKEERLVLFSNACMSDMLMLERLCSMRARGEEITEDVFRMEKKKERCPKCGTVYPDQERKICPKCMDRQSVFLRILAYFRPYLGQLVIMLLCYIGVAVLNMVWPYLNGTILYDKVLAKDEAFMRLVGLPAGQFGLLLGMLILVMFLTRLTNQALGIVQGALTARIVPEVVREIKGKVFEAMGKLSINFFNSRQTGSLMTRVLDDATDVTGFFIDGIPYFFINILTIIMTCAVMFRMNWRLAAVTVVFFPVLFLVSFRMLPRLWSYFGRRHRANRRMNAQINDNIKGARVIRAFGQEEAEIKRFGGYNGRVKSAEMAVVGYNNRLYALYSVVQNMISLLIIGLGGVMVLRGDSGMEIGVLITFIGYASQLNGPLEFMSQIFRMWTESMNSAERIFEILDAVPEIQEKADPVVSERVEGEIEFSHVTFGYDVNQPVLKDISFRVKAGEVLGIVGRSGAGKSTLVNLLSRLYDPQEGSIRIDGVDLRDLSFDSLHRQIAMVSQETYIFMGTVAENIAYARPEATREEIIRAAMQASAHDFICRMPDGYDTMIGSSGRELSGGERQRISIARAILCNPRILILDEATASVDTETEEAIQESLEKLVIGRTTLSIAHRLSTLRNADNLIVIDDGRITEEGTQQELYELKGTYYKLMELQTKALAMRGIE